MATLPLSPTDAENLLKTLISEVQAEITALKAKTPAAPAADIAALETREKVYNWMTAKILKTGAKKDRALKAFGLTPDEAIKSMEATIAETNIVLSALKKPALAASNKAAIDLSEATLKLLTWGKETAEEIKTKMAAKAAPTPTPTPTPAAKTSLGKKALSFSLGALKAVFVTAPKWGWKKFQEYRQNRKAKKSAAPLLTDVEMAALSTPELLKKATTLNQEVGRLTKELANTKAELSIAAATPEGKQARENEKLDTDSMSADAFTKAAGRSMIGIGVALGVYTFARFVSPNSVGMSPDTAKFVIATTSLATGAAIAAGPVLKSVFGRASLKRHRLMTIIAASAMMLAATQNAPRVTKFVDGQMKDRLNITPKVQIDVRISDGGMNH
jgi:hypothetical protein